MAQLIIPTGAGNNEISIGGSRDHSKLRNLDFASSGHTGFQAELTFDNDPTSGSEHPVTSGGVYSALSGKVDKDGSKVLSDNNYTTEEKAKLLGIAEGAEVNVQSDWNQSSSSADDYIKNKPDLSLKEDKDNKKTELSSSSTNTDYPSAKCVYDAFQTVEEKYEHIENSGSAVTFNFSTETGKWMHCTSDNFSVLEINIPSGEYAYTYKSRVSFDSPDIPVSVVYAASSLLINWTGTDCYFFENNSIFRPQSGKHYDITFYFNGAQFVGLVDGYIAAGGNNQPVNTASGTSSLSLSDCLDDFSLSELAVDGNISQSTSPAPDAPVEVQGVGLTNYFNVGKAANWIKLGAANKVSISDDVVTGKALLNNTYQYIARRFVAAGSSLLGKTVTVSFDCKLTNWTRSTAMMVGYFANGWHYITGGDKATGIETGTYVYTYNIPSEIPSGADGFYLFWYTGLNNVVVGQTIELSEIMVLEGSYTKSTIPIYVPYNKYGIPITVNSEFKSIITIDKPLYKIDSYVDRIVIDYDRRTAMRYDRIGIADMTSLTWSAIEYNGTVFMYGSIPEAKTKEELGGYAGYCNYYPLSTATWQSTPDKSMQLPSNYDYTQRSLLIHDSDYTVATDFLTYLGTLYKPTVYFILKTETETDITSQVDWNRIPNTKTGNTVITAASNVLPTAMEAVYYTNNGGN